jgi:hypothetical protein
VTGRGGGRFTFTGATAVALEPATDVGAVAALMAALSADLVESSFAPGSDPAAMGAADGA